MNCQRDRELLTDVLGADHVGGNVQDSPILRNHQSNHIGIMHATETLCEQFRSRSARFVLTPEIIIVRIT
jgi:hypothetical protein